MIDTPSKPNKTDFRNLQGRQDTEDRLRFVGGDWVPLLVTSGFAMRKTFWNCDGPDISNGDRDSFWDQSMLVRGMSLIGKCLEDSIRCNKGGLLLLPDEM